MDLKTSNKSILSNYGETNGNLVDKCNSLEDNDAAQSVLHSNVDLDSKSGHENEPNLIQVNEQHLISSASKSNSPLMSTASSSKVLGHYKSESKFGQALQTLEPCSIYSITSKKESNLFPNSISKLSTLYQPLTLPNGQVKVVLRLNLASKVQNGSSLVKISSSNRHLALYDPLCLPTNQSQLCQSPKLFAFDAILDTQDPQHYQVLNKEALPELINTVINGHDAALLSLGKNGLHEAMLNPNGLMIHALSWLFAAIKTRKKQYKVKCTSAQISSKEVIDLLNPKKPCRKCILKSQSNSILDQLHEVLCGCVKKAVRCLDKVNRQYRLQESLSLFTFTLHLNQIETFRSRDGKIKELSTRCKLHLLDFPSNAETLSDTLLGISKRHQHGHQVNKLTIALQECLSSVMMCTFVANDFGQSYQEMLASCQSMNRIYKSRLISLAISDCDSTSMVEKDDKLTSEDKANSDCESINHWYTSSSDHSIDTVIFCGDSLRKLKMNNVVKRSEAPSPNLSVFSDPCKKCVNTKFDCSFYQNYQRPWSDGSRKSKRKKFWLKPSKEVWIDDKNMAKSDQLVTSMDPDDIELFNRNQRVRKWIKDHTKIVESKIDQCGCAKSKSGSLTPLLQVNLNQIEALNNKAKHANQCQVNKFKVSHPNETEKCDLSQCRETSDRCDEQKSCTCDVQNGLPLTEFPKQLKLEQFLQQLSSLTDPKAIPGSSKCNDSRTYHQYHITNFSLSNDQVVNSEEKNESPLLHRYKDVCQQDAFASPKRPPSVRVLSPGSAFSYNLNLSEIILPSTPQLRCTTNSTSTSGHGTTSEGDDRSKNSIEFSVQTRPPQVKVDFLPGLSDYESAVQDEESSECGKERSKGKSKSSQADNIISGHCKVRQKQKVKKMISKHLSESTKETVNLDSDAISESNKCSLFCCKFIDFY